MNRQARKHPVQVGALVALLVAACTPEARPGFQGYVEGDFVYLAAPVGGYLQTLDVQRGHRVAAGDKVFAIAGDPDVHALAEAQARAGSAGERVANLSLPRRSSEVAALEANLRAAEAGERVALRHLQQQQALARQNFVSQARLDEARGAHEQAVAQVEAARQQIATFRASLGREAEVRGARADLEAARALVAQRRWLLESKVVTAPAQGEIAETYYAPGEWVAPGAPVASLLPDGKRRIRFFVPENALAAIGPGTKVQVSCDGCQAPFTATVDFVASRAEYTPPVIYSRESRQKLVFRVEAVPAPEQAARINPGLPVDVQLVGR